MDLKDVLHWLKEMFGASGAKVVAGFVGMALVTVVVLGSVAPGHTWLYFGLVALVALIGLVVWTVDSQRTDFRQRFGESEAKLAESESANSTLRADVGRLESAAAEVERKRSKLETMIERLQVKVDNPPLKVITKETYGLLLDEWNKSGPGELLLYNIELQSFATSEQMKKTWGALAEEWTDMKRVLLLLPREKVRRWEKVVCREENRFFADERNKRFDVCEIRSDAGLDEQDDPTSIGFALYRRMGVGAGKDTLHPKALVFILSRPFSKRTEPFVAGGDYWWDYHHILQFDGDKAVITEADFIWRDQFRKGWERTVDRVLMDTKPLRPVKPSELFDRLGVDPKRCEELLEQFRNRVIETRVPRQLPLRVSPGDPPPQFTLMYKGGDTINGHYTPPDDDSGEPKRAIIWIGGFTETVDTRLPRLFEKILRREEVAQFHYQVSPPPELITLTRYAQDMREVLRYVNRQPRLIIQNEIVLIARSVNGLLAAQVAAEDEFQDMLAGLILVAPVFDLVEMIDNYRAHRGKPGVRVENCWRCSPGYTAALWEDPDQGWLEFFERQVSLTLFADIIQHEPDAFALDAFVDAVGTVSKKCPVCVLSHPQDPVTGSEEALLRLRDAASGSGYINAENYRHIPIHSSHLPLDEIRKQRYPFDNAPRDEIGSTREALRGILDRVGVPTQSAADEPPPPVPTLRDATDLPEAVRPFFNALMDGLPRDAAKHVLANLAGLPPTYIERLGTAIRDIEANLRG